MKKSGGIEEGTLAGHIDEYFATRAIALEGLDGELTRLAEDLLARVPEELKTYINSGYFRNFKEWLLHLHENSKNGHGNTDKIRDPQEFDFSGLDDLLRKFELLKKAWEGIIDIEISTEDASKIEISYKLQQREIPRDYTLIEETRPGHDRFIRDAVVITRYSVLNVYGQQAFWWLDPQIIQNYERIFRAEKEKNPEKFDTEPNKFHRAVAKGIVQVLQFIIKNQDGPKTLAELYGAGIKDCESEEAKIYILEFIKEPTTTIDALEQIQNCDFSFVNSLMTRYFKLKSAFTYSPDKK